MKWKIYNLNNIMRSIGVLPEDYFFDLQEILETRFSCQEFNNDIINDNIIEKLKCSIILSPSSFNSLPFRVFVIKNKKLQSMLYKFSYMQKQVLTCSHLFCSMHNIDSNIQYMKESNIDTKGLESKISKMDKVEIDNWSKRQCYIAMSNLLIQCDDEKVDSCPMEGFKSNIYKKILKINDNLSPTVMVAIGHKAYKNTKNKQRIEKNNIIKDIN